MLGPLALLAIVALGYLVLFQVLTPRSAVRGVGWIAGLLIFGTVLWGAARTEARGLASTGLPWWAWGAVALGLLVALRLLLDWLLPWRRH